MLADWLSDAGRKAIEKMGWPEWQTARTRSSPLISTLRVCYNIPEEREILCHIATDDGGGAWEHDQDISPRVALALLRDRARIWLAERGACVALHGVYRGNVWEWAWVVSHMNPSPVCHKFFEDYDEALIAAVNATEPK